MEFKTALTNFSTCLYIHLWKSLHGSLWALRERYYNLRYNMRGARRVFGTCMSSSNFESVLLFLHHHTYYVWTSRQSVSPALTPTPAWCRTSRGKWPGRGSSERASIRISSKEGDRSPSYEGYGTHFRCCCKTEYWYGGISCEQEHDLNPFTKQPHSAQYKKILAGRKKLPVFAQMAEFYKMVSGALRWKFWVGRWW